MYRPSFDEFRQYAEQGNLVPVYRELLADLETPVSAFLKLNSSPYSYLLESVEGGEKWGRYCFLGSNPSIIFRSKGRRVSIQRDGALVERECVEDPLEDLKELMREFRPVTVEGLPRFFGGAVGYLGYDMVRFFERLPDDTVDDLNLPDCFFVITDTMVIFDNLSQKLKVVSNAHITHDNLEEIYEGAIKKIDAIISQLRQPSLVGSVAGTGRAHAEMHSNFSRDEFERAVVRCKEYIRAGDVIQVVIAQRLRTQIEADPFAIYRALRTINPSPYMFYLKLGNLRLIGSSPEVLVRLEGDAVELRPIAGTRPRGATAEEDARLTEELVNDPKERAEHIMLVDLGRNDVGRIATIGTVKVTELMVVEKYSHVLHLVSNIQGKLSPGKDCYDVIRACFPAGTLSGAPKIRAMEIIEEVEPTKRGPYGGAVGYFSFSGNMDTCIAIRTLVVVDDTAYLEAGAGIVADSEPAREYEETMSKARALLRAIEAATRGMD